MRKSVFLFVAISVCVYTAASKAYDHDIENDGNLASSSDKDNIFYYCIDNLYCFYGSTPAYGSVYRPNSVLPSRNLNTQFLLYTPENPHVPQVLIPTEESLGTSTLDPSLETKILIHGFSVTLPPDDIRFKIKDELLEYGPMNVIIVNWTASSQSPYIKAVANARAVGAEVAKMINYHVHNMNLNPKSVHMIGHSLGAQMCGFVGEKVPGIGRITGLDPAGPLFRFARSRLDKTDADFVDVIHTNGASNIAKGLGMMKPMGHLDFYPNGGNRQPGCKLAAPMPTHGEMNGPAFEHFNTTCDHSRSSDYFLESINKCQFEGVSCRSYDDFEKGKCTPNNSVVAQMGYHATKVPTKDGKTSFYLRTRRVKPYCEKTKEITKGVSGYHILHSLT